MSRDKDLVMTVRCRVEDIALLHKYFSEMGLPGVETRAGLCGGVLQYMAGIIGGQQPEMLFDSIEEAKEYLDEAGMNIGNRRSNRNTILKLAGESEYKDEAIRLGVTPQAYKGGMEILGKSKQPVVEDDPEKARVIREGDALLRKLQGKN